MITITWVECLNCGESQNKDTMTEYQYNLKLCSKCLQAKVSMSK